MVDHGLCLENVQSSTSSQRSSGTRCLERLLSASGSGEQQWVRADNGPDGTVDSYCHKAGSQGHSCWYGLFLVLGDFHCDQENQFVFHSVSLELSVFHHTLMWPKRECGSRACARTVTQRLSHHWFLPFGHGPHSESSPWDHFWSHLEGSVGSGGDVLCCCAAYGWEYDKLLDGLMSFLLCHSMELLGCLVWELDLPPQHSAGQMSAGSILQKLRDTLRQDTGLASPQLLNSVPQRCFLSFFHIHKG